MWLQLEKLHPDQFKRSDTIYDEEYEEAEQEALNLGEGILWEDTEVVEHSARLEPGTVVLSALSTRQETPDEWEDIPF